MTADRMGVEETGDLLRDVAAIVTAATAGSLAHPHDVAVEVMALQPDEKVSHWLDRIAATMAMLGMAAENGLRNWAEQADIDPALLLRLWATGISTHTGEQK